MNKKAVSPVVTTVLLVSLVLVLIAIIFLWARAFIPETVQKFESPIQDSCARVVFEAYYSDGSVRIQNNGNVPIYGVQIGVRGGLGSLEFIEGEFIGQTVTGGTNSFEVNPAEIEGNEIVVFPVLLGKNSKGELRGYVCGEESAKTIQA